MFNKIRNWLFWNAPIIITGRGLFEKIVKHDVERTKTEKEFNWKTIKPVIINLEKLRANTWDQDKITWMQQYLRDNFEVQDENN